MKGRIETSDLPNTRIPLPEKLDQPDLTRQMIGIVPADPLQFLQQPVIDKHRFPMLQSMYHTVTNNRKTVLPDLPPKPVEQRVRGIPQPGALHIPFQSKDQVAPIHRFTPTHPAAATHFVNSELNARRTSIEAKNIF
jgi:hypothetical protein